MSQIRTSLRQGLAGREWHPDLEIVPVFSCISEQMSLSEDCAPYHVQLTLIKRCPHTDRPIDMNFLIAQHTWLWLIVALLTGFLAHWALELFFLRHRMFDAEARLRRRSEELDSERFAHGRTAAELKSRLDALNAVQRQLTELVRERDEWVNLRNQKDAAYAEARQELESISAKLKVRSDELREVTEQWGTDRDALDSSRERAAQSEARLGAALQTRATLESELQSRERELANLQERFTELEGELRATSASHEALQAELAALRPESS